jgi:hypothetical protein
MTIIDTHTSNANTQNTDAGDQARKKITERSAKVKLGTLIKRLVTGLVLLLVAGVAAAGWWGYENRVTGYVTDERSCMMDVEGRELKGRRTYSYPFQEYFGYRFIDTKAITEQTFVEVRGDDMVIVGHGNADWSPIKIGTGEKGYQKLAYADTYVIMVGKRVGVSSYKAMCK